MDLFEIENAVERMHEAAEKVVEEVFEAFDISHVLAGFSGGDDSIVSTHWAMQRFKDAAVMIGDTEIGLDATRRHQNSVVQSAGWDSMRVKASPEGRPKGWDSLPTNKKWIDCETSYEEFVVNFGFPGNTQHPKMYQRLKQRAFRVARKELGKRKRGSRIMVVSGIRQDESAIRAGYKRAWQEEPKECFVWVNPFYYCSASDFEAYRQEFGLPCNPVKRQVGVSGECECGAHAREGERQAIQEVDPQFARYLFVDLTERVKANGFEWEWDEKPKPVSKWNRGQLALIEGCEPPGFMPACVGCSRRGMH